VDDCVPRLTTTRLCLRAHVPDDLDGVAAMWGNADVVRYIGGKPATRSEAWARMLRYAGMWSLLGFGFWAVVDRTTGRYLGDIGVLDARRDINPPITEPEVGWALMPHAHGRGVASEALAAVLGWADHHIDAAGLTALIEDGNAASMAIAGKFGFKPHVTTDYGGAPVHLLRRVRFAKA
jgi:RimJ/RimL family protein N-acetyltransferase